MNKFKLFWALCLCVNLSHTAKADPSKKILNSYLDEIKKINVDAIYVQPIRWKSDLKLSNHIDFSLCKKIENSYIHNIKEKLLLTSFENRKNFLIAQDFYRLFLVDSTKNTCVIMLKDYKSGNDMFTISFGSVYDSEFIENSRMAFGLYKKYIRNTKEELGWVSQGVKIEGWDKSDLHKMLSTVSVEDHKTRHK